MTVFYKWLQRMKDGGVTVALNTSWCSPGDINEMILPGMAAPFTVEGFGNNSLHTTMSVSPQGDITVAVVNCKPEEDEFTITFDKFLNGINLNRHTFYPATCIPDEKAEIIGIDKVFENISTTLPDKIPAYGVTVYTTHID